MIFLEALIRPSSPLSSTLDTKLLTALLLLAPITAGIYQLTASSSTSKICRPAAAGVSLPAALISHILPAAGPHLSAPQSCSSLLTAAPLLVGTHTSKLVPGCFQVARVESCLVSGQVVQLGTPWMHPLQLARMLLTLLHVTVLGQKPPVPFLAAVLAPLVQEHNLDWWWKTMNGLFYTLKYFLVSEDIKESPGVLTVL